MLDTAPETLDKDIVYKTKTQEGVDVGSGMERAEKAEAGKAATV